ncbi:signal peptide peptidase SppA, 36K type [delta proteobacterium NaphS2]|nr:signal peptide peptidase SppA, 36K type [delta proteobacterium NaphS2]
MIVFCILLIMAVLLGGILLLTFHFFGPSTTALFKEKIGVVAINGTISSGKKISSQLAKFARDENIRAIILRINSPGGGVGATQEIYREVQKTIRQKPVIVSMGSVAASGGYYVAAPATKIVSNPGTITGSIGVFIQFVRLEKLLSKIGVDFEIVKSGEFKDMGSPDRKLTRRDREIIEALIEDLQGQFVSAVASGRHLSVQEVQKFADGRIFSGARAKQLGLVDFMGNFQDAVEITKKVVGITGEVELVHPKKTSSELLDLFLESSARHFMKAFGDGAKGNVLYRWDGSLNPSS